MKKILILSIVSSFRLMANIYTTPPQAAYCDLDTVNALAKLDNTGAELKNNYITANGMMQAGWVGLKSAKLQVDVQRNKDLITKGQQLLRETQHSWMEYYNNLWRTYFAGCVSSPDANHMNPYTIQNPPILYS